MKEGISPEKNIHALSFGDETLHVKLSNRLDLASKQFGSIKDRNEVISNLAYGVASYFEDRLFDKHITRRFRLLMLAVHEDNLARFLSPEQMHKLNETPIHNSILAAAADARRFISIRRSQEAGLDKVMAADMTFCQSIRNKRSELIRRLVLI